MGRQIINHNFSARLARSSCALIPVITPQGNIKHLRVTPSVEPKNWLQCEWVTEQNRKTRLTSVMLTTERENAGAMFLRDAYLAEGWPEGWEAYEAYLKACYGRVVPDGEDADGKPKTKTVMVIRSRDDLHFPDDLLPRAVAERISGNERRREQIEWTPPKELKRPDHKPAEARAAKASK